MIAMDARRSLVSIVIGSLVSACVLSAAETAPAPAPVPPAEADASTEKPDKPSEDTVRKRFLLSYQTAKNPAAKASVVAMLKGLTEKESRRLLAGMLGDHDEDVRIAACRAMSATPDADGYFVKPLMGALTDPSDFVRINAADALGSEKIRGDAVKALVNALTLAVGGVSDAADDKRAALVISAYNNALERLSSRRNKEKDPRNLSVYWIDYWKQNEDEIRAKDLELKGKEPEPVRPDGLEPDSFDKPAKKPDDKVIEKKM